jgi:hypothetical protein
MKEEIRETMTILGKILQTPKQNIHDGNKININDRGLNLEKYISYLVILGIITDYSIDGFGNNMVFVLEILDYVIDYIGGVNNDDVQYNMKRKIIDSTYEYIKRYFPKEKEKIEEEIIRVQGGTFKEKAIRYLISFIYNNIAYQRKESIRTMIQYCNTNNPTPEILMKRLVSYFDRSKYTDRLEKMSEQPFDLSLVKEILEGGIENYDDAEKLL